MSEKKIVKEATKCAECEYLIDSRCKLFDGAKIIDIEEKHCKDSMDI